MRKVLVVTYYWPPAGGPGVQRVLKFCKYLPEFGWKPVILTVRNGEFPNIDNTFINESKNMDIHKTMSLDPFLIYKIISKKKSISTFTLDHGSTSGFSSFSKWIRLNCFLPDARKGWVPFGIHKGKDVIKNENIDLIFSSGPPHSLHFIAKKLKEIYQIPWVADFRDPWTDIFHLEGHSRLDIAQKIDQKKENKILTSADVITTVSSGLQKLFRKKQIQTRVKVITNGYDESDFIGHPPLKNENKKIIISYVGGMAKSQIQKTFFLAIKNLKKLGYALTIQFVGNVHPDINEWIERFDIKDEIIFIGYEPHHKAIHYMISSNFLLLVVPKTRNNKGIVTGKVFEYLRAKTPIICIGPPDSDVGKIILETQSGLVFNYDDSQGIETMIRNSREFLFKGIEVYERKRLTGTLCTQFNQLMNN